eukprot:11178542-Lingulodinium_polyedra.AAC.1
MFSTLRPYGGGAHIPPLAPGAADDGERPTAAVGGGHERTVHEYGNLLRLAIAQRNTQLEHVTGLRR